MCRDEIGRNPGAPFSRFTRLWVSIDLGKGAIASVEISVRVPPGPERVLILGSNERNLKMIREALGVDVSARDSAVVVTGDSDAVVVARRVLDKLAAAARQRKPLERIDVLNLIASESVDYHAGVSAAQSDSRFAAKTSQAVGQTPAPWNGELNVYAGGRPIRARTPNQEKYLKAVQENDLVFAIGPAGTGKTYLAVAAAVHLLKADRVKRLILVRPAVEAGEKLGFLPGDVQAKVNPYLRPLFDALQDMMDYPTVRRFIDHDVVEVVPLAFMRGRTLNHAVIILDEAQNTTKGQMKMFLTRMGDGSKTIVTGDATQIDLPEPSESGLLDAANLLKETPGVGFVQLERVDVVRHPMVEKIVAAYGEERVKPKFKSNKAKKSRSGGAGKAADVLYAGRTRTTHSVAKKIRTRP